MHTGDRFWVDATGNFWFVPFAFYFLYVVIHTLVLFFRFADRVKVIFLLHPIFKIDDNVV